MPSLRACPRRRDDVDTVNRLWSPSSPVHQRVYNQEHRTVSVAGKTTFGTSESRPTYLNYVDDRKVRDGDGNPSSPWTSKKYSRLRRFRSSPKGTRRLHVSPRRHRETSPLTPDPRLKGRVRTPRASTGCDWFRTRLKV